MLGIFDRGYWDAFRLRGIPVRIHWTTPIGALVFGGLSLAPAFWGAFLVLVLLHELGHAFFVRRLGHHVVAIEVTGFGGRCRWTGHASPRHRGIIAWGGVVAQAALLAATAAVVLFTGYPDSVFGQQIASAFLYTNAILLAVNLLPVEPLDGAQAWAFARDEWRRLRAGKGRRTPKGPGRPPPRSPEEARAAADIARQLEDIARSARSARRR